MKENAVLNYISQNYPLFSRLTSGKPLCLLTLHWSLQLVEYEELTLGVTWGERMGVSDLQFDTNAGK